MALDSGSALGVVIKTIPYSAFSSIDLKVLHKLVMHLSSPHERGGSFIIPILQIGTSDTERPSDLRQRSPWESGELILVLPWPVLVPQIMGLSFPSGLGPIPKGQLEPWLLFQIKVKGLQERAWHVPLLWDRRLPPASWQGSWKWKGTGLRAARRDHSPGTTG